MDAAAPIIRITKAIGFEATANGRVIALGHRTR